MFRSLLSLLLLFIAAPALAQPITPAALRRHIDVLASDAFEGREPGTEGERKTIAYISGEMRTIGLEPAGPGGGWYQPLELTMRKPAEQTSLWQGKKKRDRLRFDQDSLLLVGRTAHETVEDAPVLFLGPGAELPKGGLEGAVILVPYQAPEGLPDFPARSLALAERGAAAVIGIFQGLPWPVVQRTLERGQAHLAIDPSARVQGAISRAAAEQLFRAGKASFQRAMAGETAVVPLKLAATLNVTTSIETIRTSNVVGRLRGSGGTGESLLYLGHWDHLGICQPEGEDRICNGAVDNASGIAAMLEIARALAKGERPKRDILFLATTSEEKGLLGARYFGARPVVPLGSIVAAINLDTVAIAPRGEKVAVMGKGNPALDALIAQAAAEAGRTLDHDDEAAILIERQDGWELQRLGVPALMVGGSFSDMSKVQAFLQGSYHSPADNPGPQVELGGAAEDAELMVALGRKLADPLLYPAPRR